MKVKKILSCMMIIGTLFFLNNAFAKRAMPEPVPPITYQGITYSAFLVPCKGGFVEASDTKTNKLLWKKKIYPIKCDQKLETDVQDIYIKSMLLKDDNLLISDEKNRSYQLNIKTRQVKSLSL